MKLPYAYYSEIVQTIAAIFGFILAIWAVWDARKEEGFWQSVLFEEKQLGRLSIPTESRYEIAKVHVKSELATVVAQVILLVVGVSGLFLAPPDGYLHLIYYGEMIGISISRYGMTAVTCVLSFKSFIRRRGRVNYMRARRRLNEAEPIKLPIPTIPKNLEDEENAS